MRGSAALADAVHAEGVAVVFGVLGDGNLGLVTGLVDRGVRFVAARHEAGAVAMADGYARASGRPGIATVTHGPGLTQVGTPLTTARRARSPVLVLAGDTPRGARGHAQDIDQGVFALATAGSVQPLRTRATLPADVRAAFRHVRTGRGPIVLNAPLDVQDAEADDAPYVPSSRGLPAPHPVVPPPGALEDAAALVARSARPVVLAGRGAVQAGARPALAALAARLGAPLATTLLAKGWLDGVPGNLGVCGGFSTPDARAVLARADAVLAFGASFSRFTVDGGRLFPDAALLRVDPDPAVADAAAVPDAAVAGDARLTAESLAGMIAARPPWAPEAPPERAPLPPVVDTPEGVDPRAVLRRCDALLPAARQVVVGIGAYSGWGALELAVPDPRGLLLPWELGAVGLALPVGIGAAVARPDLTTVVVEGDGGLVMSFPELDTAAREALPVIAVVLDDRAYGAEVVLLGREGRAPDLARFAPRDLAAVARALGWDAVAAGTVAELDTALDAALRGRPGGGGPGGGRPLLVHARTVTAVHDEMYRALSA